MCAHLGEPAVAMEALVFVSVLHEVGDEGPFFGVLLVEGEEVLVFVGRPCFDFAFFDEEGLLFNLKLENFAIVIWMCQKRFFHF